MEGVKDKTNKTYTENMAVARKSSDSSVLDLFAKGGALRKRGHNDIVAIFSRAFAEDKLLATKCAFYLRDIRGGMGERKVFRVILNYLAENYPNIVLKNIELVPFFGRWDDLYSAFDTEIEEEVAQFMKDSLDDDLKTIKEEGGHPSLLAKWLASENASSEETKRLARKTMNYFGMAPREYRKTLSKLREEIGIVEKLMSENRWEEIDFEKVPSQASRIYRDAFKRHQPERYKKYLEQVESGEAEMKAGATFPYEIVRPIINDIYLRGSNLSSNDKKMLNAQWNSLPEFDCTERNAIAVVDTSGSMFWDDSLPLPATVALSLGLYFAEHNEAEGLKNKFITFSSEPELIEVKGDNLYDKINNMGDAHWDNNTDIEAVFDLILKTAEEYELDPDEIPQKLYIISDMEFDHARGCSPYGYERDSITDKRTLMQKIADKFSVTKYDMPLLVFWNVDSRQDQVPVKMDETGFQMVSGCSPNIFKWAVDNEATNAYDLMIDVLSDERYDVVTV